MIRFGSLAELNKRLAQVAVTSSVGEELSANRCVLIRQPAFDRTEFTSVEPGRAMFTRYYLHSGIEGSGGDVGDEFLVDYKSIKERLGTMRSAQVNTLTLQLVSGLLRLRADLAQVNGRSRERGNLLLRQYPGSQTDLALIPEATSLVAQIPAEQFNTLIFLLNNFGDFTGEKFEGTHTFGRLILLSLGNNQIEGVTNTKTAYGAYLSICQPALTHLNNSTSFSIEGRFLLRLLDISKEAPVEVYKNDNDNWITFAGDQGRVTILATDTPIKLLREANLLNLNSGQLASYRGTNIQDLFSALTMHSNDPNGRSDVLLLEDQAQLVIAPAHNITSKEYSCVPIDPTQVWGATQPVIFSGVGAKAIVDALKKFLLKQRLPTNSIVLTQRSLSRPSGAITWLLYFTIYLCNQEDGSTATVNPTTTTTTTTTTTNEATNQTNQQMEQRNWVTGLIFARGAEQCPDLLSED